jgi:hypothetical protein
VGRNARVVSSAAEQPVYTRQVTGSNPVPPTEDRRRAQPSCLRKRRKEGLCERFAAPVIDTVTCQEIKTSRMQEIVDAAPTPGEGVTSTTAMLVVRACLLALVSRPLVCEFDSEPGFGSLLDVIDGDSGG